jgi:UDP-glucose 4-epimerase
VKLIVTGGAGYIGSVVAAQLIAAGHDVVVVDDLSKGHRHAVPAGASFIAGSLLDEAFLRDVITGEVHAVLHFAARSLVSESVAHPELYYRTNVCGTLNLLDAMRSAGVRALVFSSTAAVYGEPDEVPIPETAPTRPTNPYGASKLAVDQMLSAEAAAHGLGAVSLRYFNVAGASGPYGEQHAPETHLIPLVLQVAAGERDAAQIFGTDYPTADGSAVRDYIHVEDLARAHLLALEQLAPGRHDIFNLGNGTGFSVRQVIETVRSVTRHPIPHVEVGRRAGDPAVLVASSDKISGVLGWRPAKPSLDDMVADAWAWMQAQRSLQARPAADGSGTAPHRDSTTSARKDQS